MLRFGANKAARVSVAEPCQVFDCARFFEVVANPLGKGGRNLSRQDPLHRSEAPHRLNAPVRQRKSSGQCG